MLIYCQTNLPLCPFTALPLVVVEVVVVVVVVDKAASSSCCCLHVVSYSYICDPALLLLFTWLLMLFMLLLLLLLLSLSWLVVACDVATFFWTTCLRRALRWIYEIFLTVKSSGKRGCFPDTWSSGIWGQEKSPGAYACFWMIRTQIWENLE